MNQNPHYLFSYTLALIGTPVSFHVKVSDEHPLHVITRWNDNCPRDETYSLLWYKEASVIDFNAYTWSLKSKADRAMA